MSTSPSPPEWLVGVGLTIGVLAVSTAAILIRLAMTTAGTNSVGFSLVLAASRLAIAAIVLLPLWRTLGQRPTRRLAYGYAVSAGIALALHFATWITSLAYTSIAASTTLVTTSPVWVALLSWRWFGETPLPSTWLGIAVALLGGGLIGLADTSNSRSANPLLGDGLALVGAIAASVYFLLGREAQRQGLSVGHYATVAYSAAAIVLLPLPFLAGTGYTGYSPLTYSYILLMALVPQLFGHTSLNWCVRWVSPTLVAIVILLEPVISSVLAYLLLAERPGPYVLIGAVVLLVGVAIAATAKRPSN